jgi:hypothetical protein
MEGRTMADRVNDQLEFKPQQEVMSYEAEFNDPLGNRWRVEMVGERELVEALREQRPFFFEARPLEGEALEQFRSQARATEIYIDRGMAEQAPQEQGRALPSLHLGVALVEQVAPPFEVAFLIDPPLSSTNPVHHYWFQLSGSESVAVVDHQAGGGAVNVELYGNGCYDGDFGVAVGRVATPSVFPGSTWTIRVSWAGGAPSYSLSGSIWVG